LRSFKDRLTRSNALFDQDLFLRHLEAAYETMAARARRGEKPSSFTVAQ
jgi:hypothetical protein